MKPPIKWVGGKSRLSTYIVSKYPSGFDLYVEPFMGSAACYLHAQACGRVKYALLCDINSDLISFYVYLQSDPLTLRQAIIDRLPKGETTKDWYYPTRDLFLHVDAGLEKAALFYILNKTSFNGLFRTNKIGDFNVPFGGPRIVNVPSEADFTAWSAALQSVNFVNQAWQETISKAQQLSTTPFMYVDPPYDFADTVSFTSYSKVGFTKEMQGELARTLKDVHEAGGLFLLSNADTPLIRELYSGFNCEIVFAPRSVSRNGDGRKPVPELLIWNYGTPALEGP